jgi:polar amino acid transport system ATP-binding protein
VFNNLTLAARLLAKENNKKNGGSQEELKKEYAKIDEEATKLLERVGLKDKMKAYPCELSGGQQQRVAIARALILNPDILCFDEPTSALDPELTGEVLRVIEGLKSNDNTMIIVTHEMEFARRVASKIIFIADGVIEEIGTPEEVFENPKSEKLKSFFSKSVEVISQNS